MIVIGIDDICRLFQDYIGKVGFPSDAKPVKFLFNPQKRKLGLVVESEEFTGPQQDEDVKFDLKRVFAVGGK
jgi:hypothetical protein